MVFELNIQHPLSLLLEQIEDSIFKAAELGDIDSVKQYLDGGVGVNSIAILGSALHYAIHANHKKVAEFLIDRGANVNASNGWGRTPLFFINGSCHFKNHISKY